MKIQVQDSTYILSFCLLFLDDGSSVNIIERLPKSSVLILAMVIEGTVSEIFYLGPSSRFMCFRKIMFTFLFKYFLIFGIKKH